ncbi:hypothetical protein C8Q80DRAFT_1348344 [Daedaleopsis nitida]|nr:hypothetical protein C8Q80DRAFT_1348344 [Daedaleopsis nitida]
MERLTSSEASYPLPVQEWDTGDKDQLLRESNFRTHFVSSYDESEGRRSEPLEALAFRQRPMLMLICLSHLAYDTVTLPLSKNVESTPFAQRQPRPQYLRTVGLSTPPTAIQCQGCRTSSTYTPSSSSYGHCMAYVCYLTNENVGLSFVIRLRSACSDCKRVWQLTSAPK